jgi:HemY protein
VQTYVDLLSYFRQWQEALQVINSASRQFVFDKDETNRLTAILKAEQGLAMIKDKNRLSAIEMLSKAVQRDPSLQAAAIALAEQMLSQGGGRAAARVIRRAWKYNPHPGLEAAYLEIYKDNTPEKRLKKVEELAQTNPQAIEARLLLLKQPSLPSALILPAIILKPRLASRKPSRFAS